MQSPINILKQRITQRASSILAFTLIEMSLVLVIIGLIVGGVLVGQSLIKAAEIRATVTQMEKYQTAVNTFRDIYNGLPGDLNAASASQFGFAARGQYKGEGDGNGLLEANFTNALGGQYGTKEGLGETGLFWVDLSSAHMIDGFFNAAVATTLTLSIASTGVPLYLPAAKIGRGNFIYAWSGGWTSSGPNSGDTYNYFGLSMVTGLEGASGNMGRADGGVGMTVAEASGIDQKIDDGLPQSGRVLALYLNGSIGGLSYWAAGAGNQGASSGNAPTTAATPGSATTCYDNSNVATGSPGVAGAAQHYSVEINNGSNVNCALSFRFQ